MKDKVLLNIGCGSKRYPGFINVDAISAPHVDFVTNNLASLPFESGSADLVYMCHVLEHVKKGDLSKVITEMHRVLRPGGIFRVSVPGFDKLVTFYNNSGRDISSVELQLMGGQNHEYNFHYSVFNQRKLTNLFLDAGFRKVSLWNPDNCQYHDFRDRASREISLNIEGVS